MLLLMKTKIIKFMNWQEAQIKWKSKLDKKTNLLKLIQNVAITNRNKISFTIKY